LPNKAIRAQVLARAANIVGGVDILAERLAVTPEMLGRYLRGESVIPPEVFLKATEIITAKAIADAGVSKPFKPAQDSE
jgi:hypothetical protein